MSDELIIGIIERERKGQLLEIDINKFVNLLEEECKKSKTGLEPSMLFLSLIEKALEMGLSIIYPNLFGEDKKRMIEDKKRMTEGIVSSLISRSKIKKSSLNTIDRKEFNELRLRIWKRYRKRNGRSVLPIITNEEIIEESRKRGFDLKIREQENHRTQKMEEKSEFDRAQIKIGKASQRHNP